MNHAECIDIAQNNQLQLWNSSVGWLDRWFALCMYSSVHCPAFILSRYTQWPSQHFWVAQCSRIWLIFTPRNSTEDRFSISNHQLHRTIDTLRCFRLNSNRSVLISNYNALNPKNWLHFRQKQTVYATIEQRSTTVLLYRLMWQSNEFGATDLVMSEL